MSSPDAVEPILDAVPILYTSNMLWYSMFVINVGFLVVFLHLLFFGKKNRYVSFELSSGCVYYSTILPAVLSTAFPAYLTVVLLLGIFIGTMIYCAWSSVQAKSKFYLVAASVLVAGAMFSILNSLIFPHNPSNDGIPGYIFSLGVLGKRIWMLLIIHSVLLLLTSGVVSVFMQQKLREEAERLEEEEIIPIYTWSSMISSFVQGHAIAAGLSSMLVFFNFFRYSWVDMFALFSIPIPYQEKSFAPYVNYGLWVIAFLGCFYYRSKTSTSNEAASARLIKGAEEELWKLSNDAERQESSSQKDDDTAYQVS